MTERRRHRFALSAVAPVTLAAGAALGATGDLSHRGCVQDNDTGGDICATAVDGLDRAEAVAVSADRKSLYALGVADHAVVQFDRVQGTGALVPRGCVEDDDTGPDGCTQQAAGLGTPRALALSPDGRSLYVASSGDNAVVRFNRGEDGALVAAGCVDDEDTGPDACAQTAPGLAEARGITVSPDGESVYAVSQTDDAIVHFARARATGALEFQGCIDDNDTGADGCSTDTDGLAGASGVAVSPDGRSVYVGALGDHAVVAFARDTGDGTLTPLGCVDDNDNGADACGADGDGLNGATGVQVSPDGKSVYAASELDAAVVRFIRDPEDGALTHRGCIDDSDTGADDCAATDGLAGAKDVGVSPDGLSVYVSGFADDAIVRFGRDPTGGLLTPLGCVADNDTGPEVCAQDGDGLNGAFGLAMSLDGRFLYAAARDDDAVAVLEREDSTPPQTRITNGPRRRTRRRSARLAFRSTEPLSTFRCRLDGGRFRRCTSPKRYRGIDPGRHEFRVRAIDPSANSDPSPATKRWRVRRR